MCKELLDHATCAASVEDKAFLIQPLGEGHGQHAARITSTFSFSTPSLCPESRVAAWVEAAAQILGVPAAGGQEKKLYKSSNGSPV